MRSSSPPVLLIHQGALGDLLLSLPALYSLRRHYEDRPWTMVGNPAGLTLLHRSGYAREVLSRHSSHWADLYRESPVLPDPLRRFLEIFEMAYVFAPRPPEPFFGNLDRALPGRARWIPSFPDPVVGLSVPQVQRECLARWKIPWKQPEILLFPDDRDRRAGMARLNRIGLPDFSEAPLTALHPGSGGRQKCWPLENFLSLAGRLRKKANLSPFFILGPVEEETRPRAAAEIVERGFPVLRDTPLTELAGVLCRAAVYLGNDSGVTHLAASLNRPVLALYGPTDPRLWGPAGKKTVVLTARAPNSLPTGEAVPGWNENMWSHLTVDRVFQEMIRLLK